MFIDSLPETEEGGRRENRVRENGAVTFLKGDSRILAGSRLAGFSFFTNLYINPGIYA